MNGSAGIAASLLTAVRGFVHHVDSGTTDRIVARLLSLAVDAADAERSAALWVATAGDAAARQEILWCAWRDNAQVSPQAMAWALAAADSVDTWHRAAPRAELVWTGPSGAASALRRTDQALLDVIRRARHRLLIVSFAVYRVDEVQKALLCAVERGVALQLVLETRESSGGRFDGDPVAALDPRLVESAGLWVWPFARRPKSPGVSGGLTWGVLHAKCALADEDLLFLSSANLTGAALELNMELGVLIEGGKLPREVASHFAELVARGELERVQSSR